MSHTHRIQARFVDPERAALVEASLAPEVGEIADDRSAATVARDGATVRVELTAADLTALRAGTNTWLGLLASAESALSAADGRGPMDVGEGVGAGGDEDDDGADR